MSCECFKWSDNWSRYKSHTATNCHLKTEFVLYWKEKCGKNPKVFHKWIFLSPLRSSYRKMWIWSPEKVGKKTWVEKLLHGSLWYKEFYFNHKKNTNVIWRTFGDPCWKVFLYVRLNSLLKMFNPVRKHVLVRRMFWISFFFFFSFFFCVRLWLPKGYFLKWKQNMDKSK